MKFQYTVIGAGVVGLAIARTLAKQCPKDDDVLVVEKEDRFGTGTSSRNSEVIHAGIYYPSNSLKHRLCIQGRRLLYDYCETYQVPYKKCGKLIVATSPEEIPALEAIAVQAKNNEVENVIPLTASEAAELEPDVYVVQALLSKETGILDTHAFMQSLEKEIQSNNGTVVYNAQVQSISCRDTMFTLRISDGTEFQSRYVINAAGLQAMAIAAMVGIEAEKLYPCKGNYFHYAGPHRCNHLIYLVPEKKLTGLGVHATLDMAGRLKFGPDTEYVDSVDDYQVNKNKQEKFYQSACRILKNIEKDYLVPDMAGMRPKIQGPDDRDVKDFYIREEKDCPGFVNLQGIESPGLTSALAIGGYVVKDILGLH